MDLNISKFESLFFSSIRSKYCTQTSIRALNAINAFNNVSYAGTIADPFVGISLS